MFSSCHNITDNGNLTFVAWPDGKPYLDQCSIVFEMFSLVRSVFSEHKEREAKKAMKKAKGRI